MGMAVGKKGVKHDINITPYIDILLVLLIIFMTSAPLKQHEQPVRVPQPAPTTQPKNVKPDSIILEIDLDRTLRINTMPVKLENLGPTLFDIFSRRVNKNMFIRGDANLPYGDVFKVLDIAKQSGVADIALLDKGEVNPTATTAKGGQ